MSYEQEARDANNVHEIAQSCQVIKRHASFIGVTAGEIVRLSEFSGPGVMDELNEAAGVMQRAIERIEKAKDELLRKMPQAAE